MSLDFQFGKTGDPAWQARWDALTADEKGFYHNFLPFVLMGTEIGRITEESIPHIVKRARVVLGDEMDERLTMIEIASTHGAEAANAYWAAVERGKALVREATPKGFKPDPVATMRRFIGMRANVYTLTSSEFIKRRVAYKDRDAPVPTMTKAQATAISNTKVTP